MDFFSKEHTELAAKQLYVPNSHEIFFVSRELDFVQEEYEDALRDMCSETGYMSGDDAIEVVQEHIKPVPLPADFCFVGMQPQGGGEPKYGLVDFSSLGAA